MFEGCRSFSKYLDDRCLCVVSPFRFFISDLSLGELHVEEVQVIFSSSYSSVLCGIKNFGRLYFEFFCIDCEQYLRNKHGWR